VAEDCCQKKSSELAKLNQQQSRVLWAVLAVNAGMFVVEFLSGIRSASLSLTGDSLDMLGDAIAYASSLYVINKGRKSLAKSALLKGMIMFLSAVAVLARATYQSFFNTTPELQIMGIVGVMALCANGFCLLLLTRHRSDNINMSSVWLCSRNDIIANLSVLLAAGLVLVTGSSWPDLAIGLLLTIVFAQSAGKVLLQSWQELQT